MKNIKEFLYENVQFLVIKISIYLNRRVFVMIIKGNKYTVSSFGYRSCCTVFMVIFVKRSSLKITKVIISQS